MVMLLDPSREPPPSKGRQHILPTGSTRGRRTRGDGHAECSKCESLCTECERLGRHCRRASCSTFCHRLHVLDVRALLLELFDDLPDLQPDLVVRVSGHDLSLDAYWQFRRTITDEFSRAKIAYVLVTSFDPFLHDAGFVRGAKRRDVVTAIKKAARRCGITLRSSDFAVAKIHDVAGYVVYLTKAEEIVGPAPRYYRVCTLSRRFLPIGVCDGRTLMWLLRATHPDPARRRGHKPSDAAMTAIMMRIRQRRERDV